MCTIIGCATKTGGCVGADGYGALEGSPCDTMSVSFNLNH